MQLMYSPASPFVRKVRVQLAEAGKTDAVALVQAASTPLGTEDAALLAANPTGKIPALIRPDGPALYDSRVICRYLDAQFGTGLYPDGRLWEVLTLEATGDALMDAGVLITYESRLRSEDDAQAAWLRGQWLKITRTLDAVESRWLGHLAGPLDAGQIALACALGYLDFRHGAQDWRATRPGLAGWYAGFAARPSMLATAPDA